MRIEKASVFEIILLDMVAKHCKDILTDEQRTITQKIREGESMVDIGRHLGMSAAMVEARHKKGIRLMQGMVREALERKPGDMAISWRAIPMSTHLSVTLATYIGDDLRELMYFRKQDFAKQRGVGKKTLAEVEEIMAKHGILWRKIEDGPYIW